MTPEEIQRTMDFILRSQADSLVRHEKLPSKVNSLADITADLVQVSRHTVERTANLAERTFDMDERFQVLLRIAESHSSRLDRLEGSGS